MVSFKTPDTRVTLNHSKALQQVVINRGLTSRAENEIRSFIGKRIAGFGGRSDDDSPLPTMIFERSADASRFAGELSKKLNIKRDYIAVKAWM